VKRIRKSVEPAPLVAWKASLRPRTFIPDWEDFDPGARSAVRVTLHADQGQICCYCMGSIANGAFHIEHFKPRNAFEHLTYSWLNMLASCEGYSRPDVNGVLIESQLQCGQYKDNWFEAGVTIDPLRANVEKHFRFRLDGRIAAEKSLSPQGKAAVDETIRRLNLNAPSLIERRKQLLILASDSFKEMGRAEWRAKYLRTPAGGPFQEFWSALAYNFNKHWDAKFANP
jgi:uncharacterized protein (TIGR02646 family)